MVELMLIPRHHRHGYLCHTRHEDRLCQTRSAALREYGKSRHPCRYQGRCGMEMTELKGLPPQHQFRLTRVGPLLVLTEQMSPDQRLHPYSFCVSLLERVPGQVTPH